MSTIYFPFNSQIVNGVADRTANAEHLAAYLDGIITNGVVYKNGTDLKVSASSGMTVQVLAGSAYINGRIFASDEAHSLTLETANATLSRIDRIVLRLNLESRLIELDVLTGTPTTNPVAPALTRTTTIHELGLANIIVAAGATSISSGIIVDTRQNNDVCGWVTNLVQPTDQLVFECDGVNDNQRLRELIEALGALQYRMYIKIKGSFGINATVYSAGGQSYSFAYVGGNNITLDFSECDIIVPRGKLIYAEKITIRGLSATAGYTYVDGSRAIITAVDATLIDCDVTGNLNCTEGIGYSVTNSRMVRCKADVNNTGGTCAGVKGSKVFMTDCDFIAHSSAASAYGADVTSSYGTNCRFEAETESAATTASGSGAIASGNYNCCLFIGKGALKGHGLYLRTAFWFTGHGCTFRGYTKDTTNGLGIGITGAGGDNSITFSMFGINCNQVALAGYSQTGSFELQDGYGAYSGTFWAERVLPDTMTAYGAWQRNRV